jgi:carbonic anhydrase
MSPEALRRTEQRAVILQLERLMGYPMVRERVEQGLLALHGWHYVIEEGEVHVFDVKSGEFVPASSASHSGTGPYQMPDHIDSPIFNEIDDSYRQR